MFVQAKCVRQHSNLGRQLLFFFIPIEFQEIFLSQDTNEDSACLQENDECFQTSENFVRSMSESVGTRKNKNMEIKRTRTLSDKLHRIVNKKPKPKKFRECLKTPPYSTYVSVDDPLICELVDALGDSVTSQSISMTHYYKGVLLGEINKPIDYVLEPLGSRNFFMMHIYESSK